MIAVKALPLYQAEAKKKMEMGAAMTNQKLGRATNVETLPPISEEASPALPKETKSRNEKESSYPAGTAMGGLLHRGGLG